MSGKCGCYVRLDNENAVCYEGIHAIVYCPLHSATEELREELDGLHGYYVREWKAKGIPHKIKKCKICALLAKASQPAKEGK